MLLRMELNSLQLILGISLGVVIGVLLTLSTLLCFRCYRRMSRISDAIPISVATNPDKQNLADACKILSNSTVNSNPPAKSSRNSVSDWFEGFIKKNNVIPCSGILEYTYRDLQKATSNFTTLIGQGSFGPVYKAQMSNGEITAVKVLASNSKQGEKEFQTEVILLGRLHHRNLMNLVGYCAEKGQHMLVYVYMSKGSLASHLYSEKHEPLCWALRVHIALDVARGLEYLHDGAVPPVIHRDIKSSNILLDESMKARVADFGLSREEMEEKNGENIEGTIGYVDPEYVSTRTFTKKSDVYSFGVLLFELIAGRNPQQGLMEYVELAAMNAEGKVGWEEIIDSRIEGKCEVKEVNEVAALAYKCIARVPRKRPNMRDIVQILSRLIKLRHTRLRQKKLPINLLPVTVKNPSVDQKQDENSSKTIEPSLTQDTTGEACQV